MSIHTKFHISMSSIEMSRSKFAYYLHTNGHIILKSAIVYESDPEYFISPFVRKVWYIYENSSEEYIVEMLQEMLQMNADKQDVLKIAKDFRARVAELESV